jgi:hypothetical protein
MPRGDRTGPLGEGPRTGRGLGLCSGYNTPGFYKSPGGFLGSGNFGFGPGGRRRGGRCGFFGFRGFRNWQYPNFQGENLAQEKELLEDRLAYLEKESEAIKKRLEELQAK